MRSFQIIMTAEFEEWLLSQPPKRVTIVKARLDLLTLGHFGDHKRFDGLIEFRWMNGNRVYAFIWTDFRLVILLGGNKNAQDRDIKKAKKIRNQVIEGLRTV